MKKSFRTIKFLFHIHLTKWNTSRHLFRSRKNRMFCSRNLSFHYYGGGEKVRQSFCFGKREEKNRSPKKIKRGEEDFCFLIHERCFSLPFILPASGPANILGDAGGQGKTGVPFSLLISRYI